MRQSRHLGLYLDGSETILDRLVYYSANLSNYKSPLDIVAGNKTIHYTFDKGQWNTNDGFKIGYTLNGSNSIFTLYNKIIENKIKPLNGINKNDELPSAKTDCSNYCNLVWSLVFQQWIDFPKSVRNGNNGNIYINNDNTISFNSGDTLLFQRGSNTQLAGAVRFVYFKSSNISDVGNAGYQGQHFYLLLSEADDDNRWWLCTENNGEPSIGNKYWKKGILYMGWGINQDFLFKTLRQITHKTTSVIPDNYEITGDTDISSGEQTVDINYINGMKSEFVHNYNITTSTTFLELQNYTDNEITFIEIYRNLYMLLELFATKISPTIILNFDDTIMENQWITIRRWLLNLITDSNFKSTMSEWNSN